MKTSEYDLWKNVEERFKFFLMLVFLCGCGYLGWQQLIYIVFMLVFGGMAAATVPLYAISQEKLRELPSLNEVELERAMKAFREAEQIISDFSEQNPDISAKLDKITDVKRTVKRSQSESVTLRQQKKQVRENHEEEERQRRKQREDWLQEKRSSKNLCYGAPPDPETNKCPQGYPIRATENLTGKKYQGEQSRGIYYEPGDPDYTSTASWCFESIEKAIADGFRASRKRNRR
jgi:uncharacterized membrane protein